MYLKSLDIVGFKSFAEKTRLDFGPGMTSIVGPNGCGKSNVSDAIRWVLGEQSPKALRGSKMEDIIFNGTDDKKPLNMAEVSMTLADCEELLGTEYNEITVTRRVFRSGEGQYMINKIPCRLKDIHRLFMDTGVGRNSYSLMEQGRIDMILSSRPEDRRAVFEQASGITKFKADKKEALRKLDHTEANLLRLEDIIREVKRQIGSLQRQAGKARRYRAFKEELRALDLYASKRKLKHMQQEAADAEKRVAELDKIIQQARQEIENVEQNSAREREKLAEIEREIATAMERTVETRTELESTRQGIEVNRERIEELRNLSSRDSKDREEATRRRKKHQASLTELETRLEAMQQERNAAETEANAARSSVAETEARLTDSRNQIQQLRAGLMQADKTANQQQIRLAELDDQERDSIVQRQRLEVEQQENAERVEQMRRQVKEMATAQEKLTAEVVRKEDVLKTLLNSQTEKEGKLKKLQEEISELRQRAAGKQSALDLIERQEASGGEFPAGAQMLLQHENTPEIDGSNVIGALAQMLEAEQGYQRAMESSLRAWMDAVVVQDSSSARQMLKTLEHYGKGSARILLAGLRANGSAQSAWPEGNRLVDHVRAEPEVQDMAQSLFAGVMVVDSLEHIPSEIAPGISYVTRSGSLVRGDGSIEYYSSEDQAGNPLAMRHLKVQTRDDLSAIEKDLNLRQQAVTTLTEDEATADESIRRARKELEEARQKLARQRGEAQSLKAQLERYAQRGQAVTQQLTRMEESQSPGEQERLSIAKTLEDQQSLQARLRNELVEQEELFQKIELTRSHLASEASEKRVLFAEKNQQLQAMHQQGDPLRQRIREIEDLIQNREKGLADYESRLQRLNEAIETSEKQLEPLQRKLTEGNRHLEGIRAQRQKQSEDLQQAERGLRGKREQLDASQKDKNNLDIHLAEDKVRRQSILDRIEEEYQVTAQGLPRVKDPDWGEDGPPDDEQVEERVNELKAKIEKIGPVNLVAIEEHRELEDRYQFLLQQQEDLIESKKELEQMIRKINATTLEMFMDTFQRVDANFRDMFKKLFGGGKAELRLINEEDALESGIDIVARPPGKKPQTISLLSGGERTMTAVALLFSLYQVKPSPFCFLDELDAALDDANIGRFVNALQDFLAQSQFIVITHNRQTIQASDTLYGVTMQEKGVSKIVSVKLSEYDQAG